MGLHGHTCCMTRVIMQRMPPLKRQETSKRVHDVKMTSYERRCDVMTSHRRWYDVILTPYAHWDVAWHESVALRVSRLLDEAQN